MERPIRMAFSLIAWLAVTLGATAVSSAADPCLVYAYVDGQGSMHKTTRLEAVPADLRESLVTYRDCEKARALKRGGVEVTPPPERPSPPTAVSEREQVQDAVSAPAPASSGSRTLGRSFSTWMSTMPSWQAVLLILFLAASLAGELGILVTAFRVSLFWGLGSLVLPFVGLIFVVVYWRDVWPSFLVGLLGGMGTTGMVLGVISH